VLAEAWRGGPQHQLSPLLRGCKVEELSEEQARQVGGLIARSGLDDTVDVAVAEGALRRNDAVVTSNRPCIAQVANAARGGRIAMRDVSQPAISKAVNCGTRAVERAACTLERSLGAFADSAQPLARSRNELIWSSSMTMSSDSSGADSAAPIQRRRHRPRVRGRVASTGRVAWHDVGRGASES